MKTLAFWSLLGFSVLFVGCSKAKLTPREVLGVWRNPSGANLEFFENGRFSAREIPASLLFGPSQSGQVVSEQGTWQLGKSSMGVTVNLQFDQVAEKTGGFEIPLLVSGTGESMELFFWKGEEGGERFAFGRKR